LRLGYYRYLEPKPVGARLAGDGALEDAIAGKPCSYKKAIYALCGIIDKEHT
jgi:hypothetical protein